MPVTDSSAGPADSQSCKYYKAPAADPRPASAPTESMDVSVQPPDLRDDRVNEKGGHVAEDDAGPCGRRVQVGDHKPQQEADDRDDRRADHDAPEGAAEPHGGHGREDDQAGDQE